eukprot:TRINITY_DN1902_c0_g1_i2.p1 TRINITY_DN1902_c0_g1~~TRINITY_DN1902_c0_g1_i2.p1  ORF type:complete len:206 (+),score=43.36 TRINITY_DN1902_c0_g1_i2:90-707(+)
MQALKLAKQQLRREVRALLKVFPLDKIASESLVIQQKVLNSEVYKRSRHVAIYLCMEREAQTNLIVDDLLRPDSDKVCYVPMVLPDLSTMKMLHVRSKADLESFQGAFFGIKQPSMEDSLTRTNAITAGTLDLLVMPGLAFDNQRHRCGHGAGFYDRFIAEAEETMARLGQPPPVTMALALSVQLRDSVPCDETDRTVDYLITAD